jgi:uncharacterized protein (UPF0248 family)
MTKKGKVAEIFSKALYSDNPDLYLVGYLDFNEIKETPLPEFLKVSENFETIPATRIVYIKKENRILWHKKDDKTSSPNEFIARE